MVVNIKTLSFFLIWLGTVSYSVYALLLYNRIIYHGHDAFSVSTELWKFKIQILFIVIISTCAVLFVRQKITKWRPIASMLTLINLPILMSIINNPNPEALSIGFTFAALTLCISVLFCSGNDYYQNFLRVTRALSWITLIASFCLIPFSNELAYVDGQRFNGIFSNPHGIGRLAALNIILCLYQKKGLNNLFNCSLFILSMVALVLSESISSVLSIGCTLLLVTTIVYFGLRNSIFLIILAGAILVISSDYILEPLLNALGREVHLSGRLFAWILAYDLIQHNPIFGIGMQNTKQIIFESGVSSTNFHNSFIEIAVRSGLLGLICYLAIFYWALVGARLLTNQIEDKSILGFLIIMLFFSFANSTIFAVFFIDFYLFWTIVLISAKFKFEGRLA